MNTDDNPSLIQILLGRQSYGVSPELETAWFRMILLIGLISGFVLGVWVTT
jgi:hypothetical protein